MQKCCSLTAAPHSGVNPSIELTKRGLVRAERQLPLAAAVKSNSVLHQALAETERTRVGGYFTQKNVHCDPEELPRSYLQVQRVLD